MRLMPFVPYVTVLQVLREGSWGGLLLSCHADCRKWTTTSLYLGQGLGLARSRKPIEPAYEPQEASLRTKARSLWQGDDVRTVVNQSTRRAL